MIRTHLWNLSPHLTLTALPLYLIKYCAVNVNISSTLLQKYGAFEQASHAEQVKYGHWVWVYMVCSKWPPFARTYTWCFLQF